MIRTTLGVTYRGSDIERHSLKLQLYVLPIISYSRDDMMPRDFNSVILPGRVFANGIHESSNSYTYLVFVFLIEGFYCVVNDRGAIRC